MKKRIVSMIIVAVLALSIGAGAMFVYGQIQERRAEPKPSPTPSTRPLELKEPSSKPEVDETAGWELYTDEEYHFSFKFPPGYSLEESQFSGNMNLAVNKYLVTSSPGAGGGFSIPTIFIKMYENLDVTLGEYMDAFTTGLSFDDPSQPLAPKPGSGKHFVGINSKTSITVGGKKAISFEYIHFQQSGRAVVFEHDENIYIIYLDNYNSSKDSLLKVYFPKILSTFRFN